MSSVAWKRVEEEQMSGGSCRLCIAHDSRAVAFSLSGQCLLYVFATALLLVWVTPARAKYAGGKGTSSDPYLIATARDLLDLAGEPNDWDAHLRLTADIDMASLDGAIICIIGDEFVPFSGTFDGDGRQILHYACLRPGHPKVGLFGYVRGMAAEIRNLRLVDPNVDGGTNDCVGALVGELSYGRVTGCRVENAHVYGSTAAGGLMGWNGGTVTDCLVCAEVCGSYSVGGLAGINSLRGEILRCSVDARVTGINSVGGLIGNCVLASAQWSSASGLVTGSSYIGGLVGYSYGGEISNCYSTSHTSGVLVAGGLVGSNSPSCNCSSGSRTGTIRNCYSAGRVDGQLDAGGLVGVTKPGCTVENSFWDIATSGLSYSAGGIGLATWQLQRRGTFMDAGWRFDPTGSPADGWMIRREPQYPSFAWQILDGDFDDDGDVDLRDFSELAGRWSLPAIPFRTGGLDMTGDGQLDTRDLAILCQQWLQGACPEQD